MITAATIAILAGMTAKTLTITEKIIIADQQRHGERDRERVNRDRRTMNRAVSAAALTDLASDSLLT